MCVFSSLRNILAIFSAPVKMKHIAAAFLLSVLLFNVVLGEAQRRGGRDVHSVNGENQRGKRAAPPAGFISPAELGMRLKSRRSDPYRRAPRMKRYRRTAEDPGMFKRAIMNAARHIRVKKADKA